MSARAALLAFACLAGCGRLGYSALAVAPNDGGDADVEGGMDGGTTVLPDGATPDAAGMDADVPTTSCPSYPGALVCSFFDDASGFTAYESNGQVQLVLGVLDAVTVAPGGAAYWVASFPPVTSGTLYFRGHMRIVGSFTISDVNPLMIGAHGPDDFGLDFNLVNNGRFEVNPSGGTGTVVSAATLPRDQWICLQGTITVGDGTTGAVNVTADGATLVSATGMDTLPPAGIRDLSIGIDWTAGDQVNSRIQWEDIVLSRSPVGCN